MRANVAMRANVSHAGEQEAAWLTARRADPPWCLALADAGTIAADKLLSRALHSLRAHQ